MFAKKGKLSDARYAWPHQLVGFSFIFLFRFLKQIVSLSGRAHGLKSGGGDTARESIKQRSLSIESVSGAFSMGLQYFALSNGSFLGRA